MMKSHINRAFILDKPLDIGVKLFHKTRNWKIFYKLGGNIER